MEIRIYRVKKPAPQIEGEEESKFIESYVLESQKTDLEVIEEYKCQFKDSITQRDSDKMGYPMPLSDDEDRDVYMPRFVRRFIKNMFVGGALSKEAFDKVLLCMLAIQYPPLQALFTDYVGV